MKKKFVLALLVLTVACLFIACDDSANKGFWGETTEEVIYDFTVVVSGVPEAGIEKCYGTFYGKLDSTASKGVMSYKSEDYKLYSDKGCSVSADLVFFVVRSTGGFLVWVADENYVGVISETMSSAECGYIYDSDNATVSVPEGSVSWQMQSVAGTIEVTWMTPQTIEVEEAIR